MDNLHRIELWGLIVAGATAAGGFLLGVLKMIASILSWKKQVDENTKDIKALQKQDDERHQTLTDGIARLETRMENQHGEIRGDLRRLTDHLLDNGG